MFDKILTFSKILTFLGVVFYFLGFLTVTSFLARFGIVNFQIFNARFIVAGVITCVSMLMVGALAWHMYASFPITKIFDYTKWSLRFVRYFTLPLLVSGASIGLIWFFNLGKYEAPVTTEALNFKPSFGAYDFIGEYINKIHLSNLSFDYILKYTLYILFFVFLGFIIFILLDIIKRNIWSSAIGPASNSPQAEDNIVSPPTEKPENRYLQLLLIFIEVSLIAVLLVIEFFSVHKIGISLFDFQNLQSPSGLTIGLMFAWVYNSAFITYFSLIFFAPKGNLDHLKLAIIFEPYTLQVTLIQF